MRETDTHYFFFKHQFGQWTQRDMVDVQSLTFNCCEQYMMFYKAMLFNDDTTAWNILQEKDPWTQKKLGRKVKNFDEEKWIQYRFQIVFNANWLKFTQHLDLQERLLATGNKILVEASPYDKVWGVGLDSTDDRILDQNNWQGLNLLGKTLMAVRHCLEIERV